MLHSVGGTLGIAMTFAAVIISWNLARNPAWSPARGSLLWTAGIALACTVGFIVFLMAVVPSDGKFGPDVPVGWPGRIEILAYCMWLMVVAGQAIRVRGQEQIDAEALTSLKQAYDNQKEKP
jgi:hypothetical protein